LRAWQIAGDHQRAMAAARTVWEDPLVPIERSELAAGMAKSLAALGRPEESDRLRAEAFALAPGAHWNHERRASTTALPQESGEAILPTEAYVAAPAAESGPVEPVASPVACAVWIMAVFAMVPVFGMPAGIALLVLSILLIAKRQPLPHDRRVGRAGLIAAVVSLAFALVSIPSCASAVLARLAQDRHAEQNREATQAEDESSESDEENETGASAPAAGPSARTADRQPADSHVPWHQTAIYLGVLAVSIVLHEIGHAIAAFWSGDPTARNLGRFSLNPVRHFSWVGSLIVPAALTLIHSDAVIGWAKPVPIRQERFRHPRRGLLGVTLAGVSLNMLIALIATNLMLVLLLGLRWAHADASFGNLIFPFQMVEVSGVPSGTYWAMALSICKAAVWINAFLTGFNLLPFPPLDGFGVIRALAPAALTPLLNKVTGIGMILMLALIAFKALTYLLLPGILLGLLLLSYVQFITA
jgi:Zn-dependent protease